MPGSVALGLYKDEQKLIKVSVFMGLESGRCEETDFNNVLKRTTSL